MLLALLTHTLCDVAIGIDLGTTFSCLRGYDSDTNTLLQPQIDGSDTYPSVVAFTKMTVDGKTKYFSLTGQKAIAHHNANPNSDNFFFAVKRLLGLSSKDLDHPRLLNIDKKVTYQIKRNADKSLKLLNRIDDDVRYLLPVDISACILRDLNEHAKKLGDVKMTVITVPAYFNESQVTATGQAAKRAGMEMNRTMNEPVAAAYAYQQKSGKNESDKYLIFDLGGGTLDISLLEYENKILEVMTYSGNNFLGGENVNDSLYEHFAKELLKERSYKIVDETEKLSLRSFVEDFKITLCNMQNSEPKGDAVHEKTWYYGKGESYLFKLNHSGFNRACMGVFNDIRKCIDGKEEGIIQRYEEMGGDIKTITKVLFVGGSSRLPYVRKMVAEIFPFAKMDFSLNADTCVAEGAAYFAASCAGYIGDSLHLVDVVPIPIGICVGEDQFVYILEADKAVPATGSQIFTTQYDNQQMVSIQVAQGMKFSFKENHKLGSFNLQITKPAPRGVPQIEVTVHMNQERTIAVTAKDLATGTVENVEFKKEQITMTKEEEEELRAQRDVLEAEYKACQKIHNAKVEANAFIEETRKAFKEKSIDLKSEAELHLSSFESFLSSESDVDADMIMKELESVKAAIAALGEKEPTAEKLEKEEVREEL